MSKTPILDLVDSPSDLKQLNLKQLTQLAAEIRELLLNKVSQTGGHVGPNLGDVELTIAFHYVFDSPNDKVVWDVSHQSYTHKILTGRKQAWLSQDHFDDVTGFTEPKESKHDYFNIGHTSTSIALANGMAVARDYKQEKNNIVAVIGDGSLSGGLAYEALDQSATLDSNLIIVLNDNEMSIAENHGGIYRDLTKLRESNGQAQPNLFNAIGLDYKYVESGNDIKTMIDAFEAVKNIDHPIVMHVHTEKGLGYKPAMEHKEAFHWHVPFDLKTGQALTPAPDETYADIILQNLENHIEKDHAPIVAITAAIPGSFKLKDFAAKYPKRYFDVGIAEQDSITFAAGLVQQGMRRVAFESGTFLQRAYDQLSHDLGINSLPAVVLVGGGQISGGDPTHQGTFDIPMISNIPNWTYLTPSTKEEMNAMLDYALSQTDGPVAIRIPENGVHSASFNAATFAPEKMNVIHQGSKVALLGVGSFLPLAETVQAQLKEQGIDATVIDPRVVSSLDEQTLSGLKGDHELVVTLEEGSVSGGYGEKVSRFYGDDSMNVLNFGAKKEFNGEQTTEELYREFNLTPDQIVKSILKSL